MSSPGMQDQLKTAASRAGGRAGRRLMVQIILGTITATSFASDADEAPMVGLMFPASSIAISLAVNIPAPATTMMSDGLS
jgi:hypothetical protein